MAHSFVNLGFESAGLAPGLADGWTFDQLASLELFSEYGPDIPGLPNETFERGWLSNEDFKFLFIQLLIDIFPALYDDPSAPQSFEDFDQEWDDNQFFAFTISGVSIDEAFYDSGTPESVEDYEEEWDTNEDFLFVFVGIGTDLTAGIYDSTIPETVEDFEDEWDSQPALTELVDVLVEVGVTITLTPPDTISRTVGDFIAAGVRAGGLYEFPGTSQAIFWRVEAVSALSLTVDPDVISEGPLSLTMRNVIPDEFDGGPETFEVTWAAMSTNF